MAATRIIREQKRFTMNEQSQQQQQQQQKVPQPPLSTSSAVQSSTDGLPECCSDAFRELYRRGEVPRFGCYDPVFLHPPLRDADAASSAFFPPFSSLVRRYLAARDASTTASTAADGAAEDEEEALDSMQGVRFGSARPEHSWEHITSAEDLWNGPPLTTKIPPAADYERILLDRVEK